ncbi:hypothetical protein WJX73_010017 [Symbiochloris irregularis]|uniref:Methyltransferase type 11 domain-containing protein n=1 Tax=Symbiochloris irregularis TaxID=706552 RepID=A0AAW1NDW5_9CHLO
MHQRRLLQCCSPLRQVGQGRLSHLVPTLRCSRKHSQLQVRAVAKAAARSAAKKTAPAPAPAASVPTGPEFEAACPICQQTTFQLQSGIERQRVDLRCERCSRTFRTSQPYFDLTTTSGLPQTQSFQQSFWGGTQIFRSPLVSFAYERGWRQGFSWAGFPGADQELQMALDYMRPAWGQVLLDMSCASGVFSRRFVRSKRFSGVIAADFSDSMLQQAGQYFSEDRTLDPRDYVLLKADVGRMPFATGSLAAIHAGAAMHCWPDPALAVAEISRVLKPGGVFVASTFLNSASLVGSVIGDDRVRPLMKIENQAMRSYKWWEELELKELTEAMGLTKFTRTRQRQFIMFSVRKPGTLE